MHPSCSDLEVAAALKAARVGGREGAEPARLATGTAVKAVVQEHAEYGVVLDIEEQEVRLFVVGPNCSTQLFSSIFVCAS